MTKSEAPRLDDPELERLLLEYGRAAALTGQAIEKEPLDLLDVAAKGNASLVVEAALRARVAQLVSEARKEGEDAARVRNVVKDAGFIQGRSLEDKLR